MTAFCSESVLGELIEEIFRKKTNYNLIIWKERFIMKKLLKLLFVAFMVFTVSGCSSKSASDYYNLLEENDYKFLVSYDVSHFYDKYLKCYDRSGNEIKPDRIKEKPDKSKECLLVDKNNKPKIEVFYDIKTDKTPLLFFYTDDGYYIADFKKKIN